MLHLRTILASGCLAAATLAAGCTSTPPRGATAADLNADSRQALDLLTSTDPAARTISNNARSVLVFPSIVKAGLVFGGAYGEGELRRGSIVDGYYSSYTGSWGLQAGAQSYSYAIFFMNQEAENYLLESDGWEVGVGPTVVVVDSGVAENLSTSTLQDDAYAFIFDQSGLMAGVSIEGTKITRLADAR
jgi:lipid-binding SYLF domain-containing protein